MSNTFHGDRGELARAALSGARVIYREGEHLMAALNFRHRRVRHRWLHGGSFLLAAAAFLFVIASASGNLSGSSFESGDGNMKVNTAGNTDWANVSFFYVDDLQSTGADDAYLSGQKQDTRCPVLDFHGSPPKDDFTDVATYSEVIGTDTYLYGATLRYAASGNAAENVELNKATNGFCQDANGDDTELAARVAGDKLIAIDYVSGGPQFHVLTWVTSGACNVSSHAAPCWGANVQTITGAGAEGAINLAQIAAGDNYIGPAGAVGKEKFAEFGINLTDAGIIPAGGCETFSQSTFGSRSSGSSFVSTTKDITVVNHPISNCGSISIHKEDDAGNPLEGVQFDLYTDNSPFGGTRAVGDTITSPLLSCTTDADGDCTIVDVDFGHYWVVENAGTIPAGYNGADDQAVNITNTTTVELEFVDPRQAATVNIHKEDDAGNPLENVSFELYTDADPFGGSAPHGTEDTATGLTCATDIAGDCTISDVPNGLYWVVEDTTSLPSGYSGADDQYADLTAGGASVSLSFFNPRTHRVIVIVCHEGTDTLDSSDVTLGSDTKASVATAPTGMTEKDLCDIPGASFGGLGHGTHAPSVDIATH
jgi:hypothetical protein